MAKLIALCKNEWWWWLIMIIQSAHQRNGDWECMVVKVNYYTQYQAWWSVLERAILAPYINSWRVYTGLPHSVNAVSSCLTHSSKQPSQKSRGQVLTHSSGMYPSNLAAGNNINKSLADVLCKPYPAVGLLQNIWFSRDREQIFKVNKMLQSTVLGCSIFLLQPFILWLIYLNCSSSRKATFQLMKKINTKKTSGLFCPYF